MRNIERSREKEHAYEVVTSASERLMHEVSIVQLMEHVKRAQYKTLVFLDKSARPIAHLLRATWQKVDPGLALPDFRFINPPERAVYDQILEEGDAFFDEQASATYSEPVLLVDERSIEGTSLRTAEDILRRGGYEGRVDEISVLPFEPSWRIESDVRDVDDDEHYYASTKPGSSRLISRRVNGGSHHAQKLRRDFDAMASHISRRYGLINQGLNTYSREHVSAILGSNADNPKDIEIPISREDAMVVCIGILKGDIMRGADTSVLLERLAQYVEQIE